MEMLIILGKKIILIPLILVGIIIVTSIFVKWIKFVGSLLIYKYPLETALVLTIIANLTMNYEQDVYILLNVYAIILIILKIIHLTPNSLIVYNRVRSSVHDSGCNYGIAKEKEKRKKGFEDGFKKIYSSFLDNKLTGPLGGKKKKIIMDTHQLLILEILKILEVNKHEFKNKYNLVGDYKGKYVKIRIREHRIRILYELLFRNITTVKILKNIVYIKRQFGFRKFISFFVYIIKNKKSVYREQINDNPIVKKYKRYIVDTYKVEIIK